MISQKKDKLENSDILIAGRKNEQTIIESKSSWEFIDFKEIREYRDLFFFLVWRDIKVLYAQTILGFAWAILNPLIQIIIFTIIFGKVAKITTEGTPYMLFSTLAIVPWSYMNNAIVQSSQSLVSGQFMLGKIYFPRILFPVTPVLSKFVDFLISMLIIIGVMIYFHVVPTWRMVYFPLFVFYMLCIPLCFGIWLSSLAIRFRDVRFAVTFVVRMLMYSAPIVYSAATIPENYRVLYSFNPIVGVIEGLRASLLGTQMPWIFIWPGAITTVVMLVSGLFYFKRMERIIVDVI